MKEEIKKSRPIDIFVHAEIVRVDNGYVVQISDGSNHFNDTKVKKRLIASSIKKAKSLIREEAHNILDKKLSDIVEAKEDQSC